MIWFLAGLAAIVLLISYGCYRFAFYVPPRKPLAEDVIETPKGPAYEPYREKMENWVREARKMPHADVEITSFDGLKLQGRFFEFAPGAPVEIMFHGYRGSAERDMSGGVHRCFKVRRSALVVEQRCSRSSEGNTITMGINEYRDCLKWVDFTIDYLGKDIKIILTGISMGASTVMLAAGEKLPPNVIGILADCGYTSAKAIMFDVMRKLKLPPKLCYPFVKLGAKLFGHFDLDENAPVEAMKRCTLPVIFFHGEDDDFVPCSMSHENYEACAGRKRLVTVPGAGHGLSYAVQPQRYLQELRDFFGPEGSYPE